MPDVYTQPETNIVKEQQNPSEPKLLEAYLASTGFAAAGVEQKTAEQVSKGNLPSISFEDPNSTPAPDVPKIGYGGGEGGKSGEEGSKGEGGKKGEKESEGDGGIRYLDNF